MRCKEVFEQTESTQWITRRAEDSRGHHAIRNEGVLVRRQFRRGCQQYVESLGQFGGVCIDERIE